MKAYVERSGTIVMVGEIEGIDTTFNRAMLWVTKKQNIVVQPIKWVKGVPDEEEMCRKNHIYPLIWKEGGNSVCIECPAILRMAGIKIMGLKKTPLKVVRRPDRVFLLIVPEKLRS